MTSIVITGANGFIGRLLAARLAVGSRAVVNGKDITVEKLVRIDKFVPAAPAIRMTAIRMTAITGFRVMWGILLPIGPSCSPARTL